MSENRFTVLANGDIYDTKTRKIVKTATRIEPIPEPEPPKEEPKEEPKPEKKKEAKPEQEKRPPGRPKGEPKPEKPSAARAHTKIAREILVLNKEHPINKNDAKQLWERGIWYFTRSEEEGITPTPQGIVNAWGFKPYEANLLMSGNSGLSAECREVIESFKQALEQVAEGALVDTTSGVVGKIFDLKNRFGWTDTGNLPVQNNQQFGELASPEELKKAILQMPGLDLTEEADFVDAEFEVVE